MSESESAIHGHGALAEGSPYAISSRKLTMWLFIISDVVTFGAFLFAYGYIRVATPNWTRPFETASVMKRNQFSDDDYVDSAEPGSER